MKFLLDRASDGEELGIIEINSLDELKKLNSRYNGKEDHAWSLSHSIIIDFDKENKEKGIDGGILIYDYYIE